VYVLDGDSIVWHRSTVDSFVNIEEKAGHETMLATCDGLHFDTVEIEHIFALVASPLPATPATPSSRGRWGERGGGRGGEGWRRRR